jgi:hypothetical protein
MGQQRRPARRPANRGPPTPKAADRQPIEVSTVAIIASEQTVESPVADLRQRVFHASSGPRCRCCDLCRWNAS